MTTCQLCARPIQANTGVIAHHGYRRPQRGSGWQTASCRGARFAPYEKSCSRIQPEIEWLETWIAARVAWLAELCTAPPASLSRRLGYSTVKEYPRPSGFEPIQAMRFSAGAGYAGAWSLAVDEAVSGIKSAERQIEFLRERLAAWKPVEEVQS